MSLFLVVLNGFVFPFSVFVFHVCKSVANSVSPPFLEQHVGIIDVMKYQGEKINEYSHLEWKIWKQEFGNCEIKKMTGE